MSVAALLLGVALAAGDGGVGCARCNVVLISADSVRADALGFLTDGGASTPTLDALARRSVVYEQAFATAFLTPISEASVHTGRYPHGSGLTGFGRRLAADVSPLAELLRAQGYRTLALGSSPEFEVFPALKASFQRGFDAWHVTSSRVRDGKFRSPAWAPLEALVRSKGAPFFAWVSLGAAHAPFGVATVHPAGPHPYQGPLRLFAFYGNLQHYFDGKLYDPNDPRFQFQIHREGTAPVDSLRAPERTGLRWPWPVGAADLDFLRAQYADGVRHVDGDVAAVLALLDAAGRREDTVVVFQSEHGETLGERGYVGHYDIHDETTHVPLLVHTPTRPQSARVAGLVSGVDVLPSLLRHLALPVPDGLDGEDVLGPALAGQARGRAQVFLSRVPLWETILSVKGRATPFDTVRALDRSLDLADFAVRTPTLKLVHRRARFVEERFNCWTYLTGAPRPRAEWELYELATDPGEQRPLPPSGAAGQALQATLLAWERALLARARRTTTLDGVQEYQ